ncbi:hypothetical protein [Methylococcus capsulatus]|uniref:hypothetical protein n=1 Tax=Methylococcus capsulatus TaxID=414 RepID=UPI001C5284CC|nr:hypothetical protein [Methylococcus capsulatus]QXP88695.1 hypothetical protein KW112_06210 [Methylococcus capsulatus]UQN10973.1 hypothetical protein M3M30_07935 [Methylococcus capsulatus]
MPADFPESGGTERGLMGRHVEIVVLYLKRTVFQEKVQVSGMPWQISPATRVSKP